MRKKLSSQLIASYEIWYNSSDLTPMIEHIEISHAHWQQLGKACLQLFNAQGAAAAEDIETLVENNLL